MTEIGSKKSADWLEGYRTGLEEALEKAIPYMVPKDYEAYRRALKEKP